MFSDLRNGKRQKALPLVRTKESSLEILRSVSDTDKIEAQLSILINTLRDDGYPDSFVEIIFTAIAVKKRLSISLSLRGDYASETLTSILRRATEQMLPSANLYLC